MESPPGARHTRAVVGSGVFEESRLTTSVHVARVSTVAWMMTMIGEMDRKGRSVSIDAIDR